MKRITRDLEIRFWSKVNVTEADTDCWEFQDAKDREGYGRFQRRARGNESVWRAHRFAFESFYGRNPGELCVMHSCDNPPCCNPRHLSLGTHADNVADKEAKGRGNPPRGERNASAKLTAADVREMRRMRETGWSAKAVATRFGVSQPTASRICNRLKWRHIT